MEKEPRTIKELEVSVKWSDQWHKVSHIKPFTPVLIQHHQDEGTPESYETKDGMSIPVRSKFTRTRGIG